MAGLGAKARTQLPSPLTPSSTALEDLACRSALNAALIAIVVGEQPVHLCLEPDLRFTDLGNPPSFPEPISAGPEHDPLQGTSPLQPAHWDAQSLLGEPRVRNFTLPPNSANCVHPSSWKVGL